MEQFVMEQFVMEQTAGAPAVRPITMTWAQRRNDSR
jgi:hypothetical protein